MISDSLRPPDPFSPSADAYKDWLHLNLFDHATGSIGLVNVSLHGAPWDPRARAVGSALLHLPEVGWVGNLEISDSIQARLGASSIGLEKVALAVAPGAGLLLAAARFPLDNLDLRVTARAAARPIHVERPIPFGPGWISWHAIPRLDVDGSAQVGDRKLTFEGASGYHDHNWGRWHWGDDIGWEWGAFLSPPPGPSFVIARVTDRAHREVGGAMLNLDLGEVRRTFSGPAVTFTYEDELDSAPRRLPGALAALHVDRATPRLPANLTVRAGDGLSHVEIRFRGRAAAQLIAGDPVVPGYGFLHEIVGEFTVEGLLGRSELRASGLAVVEYVN